MEKKQSSIDWLFSELDISEGYESAIEKIQQAKAMHKEELKESYRQGRTDQQSSSDSFYNRNAESYFNETFGGKK
jgi:hypothetical protein